MKLDDFTEAVRKVLLKKPHRPDLYKNRMPSNEELNRRYRLVKKR
ncbi:MAG: hypothetical protein OXN23_01295 [Gammaproteobacteria bacterium]|nr:hypothetical protein [Gammaproteobacteria bacterium]